MEKQRVFIDVEHWGQNMLLDVDSGMKCCLGFICEQVFGSEPKDIGGKSYYPVGLEYKVPEWYEGINKLAATINDNTTYTQATKMAMLKELFADTPVELVFTENGIELP
jgi:hypothetical protein